MPFLGPLFAALGAAGSALAGSKLLMGLILNLAMSLLQMLLQPKQPKPEDVKTVYRQSTPVRNITAGTERKGGPFLFLEKRKRVLYTVTYLGDNEIDGIEEFLIDDRPCRFTAAGLADSEPYDLNNKPRVKMKWRSAAAPNTPYRELTQTFPDVVTADYRFDGMATIYAEYRPVGQSKVSKVYPAGIPKMNVVGRFSKPYDPRTGVRQFTNNLALIMRFFLTHPDGADIDEELIDDVLMRKAASSADKVFTTVSGGTVRQYEGSLTWRLDEDPSDVLDRLIAMTDGRVYLTPEGKVGFKVGEFDDEELVHIPNAVIVEAELKNGASPVSACNEVIVKYTNPNMNYTSATCQPWVNQAALLMAGGRRKVKVVETPGLKTHFHARRLASIVEKKSNPEWQGTIKTTLYGARAMDRRFIRVSFDPLAIVAQRFEVMGTGLDQEEESVTLQIASVPEAVYDFDPLTDEGVAPVDPVALEPDNPPEVENFQIIATSRQAGSGLVTVLEMSCEKPANEDTDGDGKKDDAVNIEFQYALADTERWKPVAGITEETEVEVVGVTDGAYYDGRARYVSGRGNTGEWKVVENILAIADTRAPSAPTNASVAASPISAQEARVSFTAPSEDYYRAVRVYRAGRASTTAEREQVEIVYTMPRAEAYVDIRPTASGTHEYWVAAINGSGAESALVYAGSLSITL